MWPYWLLFAVIALTALSHEAPRRPQAAGGPSGRNSATRPFRRRVGAVVRRMVQLPSIARRSRRSSVAVGSTSKATVPSADHWRSWPFFLLLLSLMIGLRYQVGGDWANFLYNFDNLRWLDLDLANVLQRQDPGYELISWLALQFELDIWAVNLFCGVAFSVGLVAFARRQPDPMLALTVAVPYLVTVVAMGYTRQAVAIGFTMLALNALRDNAMPRFIVFIAAAATFHASAAVLIIVGLITNVQSRLATIALGVPAAFVLYSAILADRVEHYAAYIDSGMQSEGTFVRLAMNALPALLFFFFRKRFALEGAEHRLWLVLASASLVSFAAFFVLPSSTAVDRLGLYLIPLQIFVLARLPLAFSTTPQQYRRFAFPVVIYSAAVLFIWLNYATHAPDWIPYLFYPISPAEPI